MTDRSLRRSRLKGSRIAPVSHESRASRTEPSPAAANRVRNERTSAASDTSSAARSLDHAWYQRYHQFFSSTEHDHQSRGTHCLQWTQLRRTIRSFSVPDRHAGESNGLRQRCYAVSALCERRIIYRAGLCTSRHTILSVPDRQAAESATAYANAATQYLLSVSAGSSTELGSAPSPMRSFLYLIATQPSLQRLTPTLLRSICSL